MEISIKVGTATAIFKNKAGLRTSLQRIAARMRQAVFSSGMVMRFTSLMTH